MEFEGTEEVCSVFKEIHGLSDAEVESLWDNYLEFMVVKALCHDRGSREGMLFSATPLVDKLWQCHVLETSLYDDFMALVKRVNPTMDKIHHSSRPSLSTEAEKNNRRKATAIAYRYFLAISQYVTVEAISK